MKKKQILLLAVLIALNLTSFAQDGWTNLFNGKDLDGWKQLGGKAKYEVVDAAIVGTTVLNTGSAYLCTEEVYSDFILEIDMLVEDNMNSGIQFRSESGRGVYGYQCEIDPSDRGWSAGIFDQSRRKWLYPLDLNPEARSALKMGEWNHYRIECIGNSIKTWLNGIACSHLIDDMTPEGFIALQVHAIKDRKEQEGHQVKWKNIRIKTENITPSPSEGIYVVNLIPNNICKDEKEQGFELLFDGKSTAEWKSSKGDDFPKQGWEVQDGVLSVLSKESSTERGGDIITRKEFGPFELKFDFSITKAANSGVKYGIGNNGPGLGLEYQIIDDENHPSAKMGVDGNHTTASLYDLIPPNKRLRFVYNIGEWNRGRIVVYPDNTVQHWLNGRKAVEYKRGDNIYKELVAQSKYKKYEGFGMSSKGPILLQDHGDNVQFRSIKIRKL